MKKENEKRYFLKQRLGGVILLIIAIFSIILSGGDATAALLIIPMGLALIVSKSKLLMIDGYYGEGESENE